MNTVYSDAGHGGIHPLTDRYTTAPNKQYKHQGNTAFHREGWFYEGVFNRQVAAIFEAMCEEHLRVVRTYHPWQDIRLEDRVNIANADYDQNARRRGVFISWHANASPTHTARGTEVYDSRGKTASDHLTQYYAEALRKNLGDLVTYRAASSARFSKEANFYVLRYTKMPAMLIETLFFDQVNDATLLMQRDVQEGFALSAFQAVIAFFNEF